jgi:hypothetical protein
MTLPDWKPPVKKLPSEKYLGEREKSTLHERVGSAINEWENLESILAEIFRLLVESKSMAAARAYGAIAPRYEALKIAAIEFFRHRPNDLKRDEFLKLFRAYNAAAEYRNNVAHGICYGWLYIGGKGAAAATWFLCPPNYNTRMRQNDIRDAKYIYNASDILQCEARFKQLSAVAINLDTYLRRTYPLS